MTLFSSRRPQPIHKKSGWSISGQLTNNHSTKVVTLQVQFPEPELYTIQFHVIPPPPIIITVPPTPQPYDPIAQITWSVEGNQVNRIISITNGATISGAGSAVIINMSDNTNGAGVAYVVSALVTKGTRPAVGLQYCTLYWSYPISAQSGATPTAFRKAQSIPANGTLNVPIPLNAGVTSAEVAMYSALAVPVPVNASVQQVNPAADVMKHYTPSINIGFEAIAPGATSLTITNFDTSNPVMASVTWGIDG